MSVILRYHFDCNTRTANIRLYYMENVYAAKKSSSDYSNNRRSSADAQEFINCERTRDLQNFAVAISSPWAIAWLIRENDWDHLEQVVHYNCILLGGCNNVLIPVSNEGKVYAGFDVFLASYDPDFIILPPDLHEFLLTDNVPPLNPFGVVKWNQVPQIFSDNAMGRRSGQAAQVRSLRDV